MSGKARIGLRFREAIGWKSTSARSKDLASLKEDFLVLKERLRLLSAALAAHHEAIVQYGKTRAEVARRVDALAKNTPIRDSVGDSARAEFSPYDDEESPEDTGGGRELPIETSAGTSYASIHEALESRHESYAERYLQFVVEYAREWEEVVTKKISASLAKAEALRIELDHYSDKVQALQDAVFSDEDKGRLEDPRKVERLERNEEKLKEARDGYEAYASDLCVLMEEVTDGAWRDLHPLLLRMAEYDITLNTDEGLMLNDMGEVVKGLKRVAEDHKIVMHVEGTGIAKCRAFDKDS